MMRILSNDQGHSANECHSPVFGRAALSLIAFDDLLDYNLQWLTGIAVRPRGNEAVAVLIIDAPQPLAIGLGNGQRVDRRSRVEGKSPLVDRFGKGGDGFPAVEQKHKPVLAPFVGLFGDHAEEVQIGGPDFESDLLVSLASGALVGRLASLHFELSADWAPETLVGRFISLQHQKFFSVISYEYKDAYLVLHEVRAATRQAIGIWGSSGNRYLKSSVGPHAKTCGPTVYSLTKNYAPHFPWSSDRIVSLLSRAGMGVRRHSRH